MRSFNILKKKKNPTASEKVGSGGAAYAIDKNKELRRFKSGTNPKAFGAGEKEGLLYSYTDKMGDVYSRSLFEKKKKDGGSTTIPPKEKPPREKPPREKPPKFKLDFLKRKSQEVREKKKSNTPDPSKKSNLTIKEGCDPMKSGNKSKNCSTEKSLRLRSKNMRNQQKARNKRSQNFSKPKYKRR